MNWVWLILMTTSLIDPARFWVCLHWAHPDGIEWTTTIINGEEQWEYLQKKYPGSYRGKCKETK